MNIAHDTEPFSFAPNDNYYFVDLFMNGIFHRKLYSSCDDENIFYLCNHNHIQCHCKIEFDVILVFLLVEHSK